MGLSKVKTLAVVLTIAAAASAQFNGATNARMEALGGAPFSDITGIYAYPSLMTGYTNQVQATFGSEYAATEPRGFIAVKSINDVLSLGLMANHGMVAPEPVFAARDFLQDPMDPDNYFNYYYDYNYFPHLLLGLDFGGFSLGADIFFQSASAKFKSDSTYSEPGNTFSREDEKFGSITVFGTRISAGIDLGFVSLLAKFGIGFPSFKANHEWSQSETGQDKLSNPDDSEDSFESALYMETGAEAGMSLIGLDLTLGFDYTGSKHEFEPYKLRTPQTGTPAQNTLRETDHWYSLLDIYLGCEFNVLETMAAAAGYKFTRNAYTRTVKTTISIEDPDGIFIPSTNPASSTETKATEGSHQHTLNAGLENTWDDAWIFDAFSVRAGARYSIYYDFTKGSYEYERPSMNIKRESNYNSTSIWSHSPVTPTFGVGLSKSVFSLDLAFDMGEWQGFTMGPPVAMVTGTLKF